MKKILALSLAVALAVGFNSCTKDEDGLTVPGNGSVRVKNTHDSNYRVTINGQVKGSVSGYGTTAAYEYPHGTSIHVYAFQLDGYLFYPSEYNAYGTIEAGQSITVNF